jgi:hypothetical protein
MFPPSSESITVSTGILEQLISADRLVMELREGQGLLPVCSLNLAEGMDLFINSF